MSSDKRQKITQGELVSLCEAEFDDSITLSSQVQGARTQGLNYYNSMPFGNEEDGLSKFVSSDVRDAVEWLMPQLVDTFVGGDTPIVFEPENADDVKASDVESRYVQYLFERKNEGVIVTIQWFKDALLQKNGIVKAWAQEDSTYVREEYMGKTGQEYLLLFSDPEYDIQEVTVTINDREFSEKEYATLLASVPSQQAVLEENARYTIVGHRKKKRMSIVIENVPPEQFVIQRNHNSIFVKDASYCGEFFEKTRSELIEMGYDYDTVMALPKSEGIAETKHSNEIAARRQSDGGTTTDEVNSGNDKSRELVMIYDHYIRADFNGDGIAELRHVRTGGKGEGNILENEEVDRNIYHAITPYLNNYRFFGRSVAENLMDLQRMKSQLWRNVMDNIAYSALPRKIVRGNVDTKALMTYVQGGIIRADADATVENEITPFVADTALLVADKVDTLRAERSGFSKETMGLAPDALANSNNPVAMMILSQSQLLTKMIATIIAHSGFKSLMEHIRELVLKYEDQEKIFDLTGEFLQTDPRKWAKERSSVPKVGIGFAGKHEEISMLDRLLSLQEKYVVAQGGNINGPLTNAQGIYNTTRRLCRRIGIKDVETYFQDPSKYTPPPPAPSVQEQTLQANIETVKNQQIIEQSKIARDMERDAKEAEFRLAELAQKERLTMKEIESRERIQEKELLYKYGKDAKEHAAAAVAAVSERREREEVKKDD